MPTGKNKAAKPTAADKEAAEKLRRIWLRVKRERKITQEDIASQFGEKGVTQGNISQYIHGRIPLNARAVLRFAAIFGCSPLDIRDDLPELHSAAPPPTDDEAQELWKLWPHIDLVTRKYLLDTARGKAKIARPDTTPFPESHLKGRDRKRTSG